VGLEIDQVGPTPAVADDPELVFKARAAEAMKNADIRVAEQLTVACIAAAPIAEARLNKIVYKITEGAVPCL